MFVDLNELEQELKKRWPYNYRWEKIQNNEWDRLTNFIYRTYRRSDLVVWLRDIHQKNPSYNKRSLFNYAANRRYNFWSSQWVEQLFKLNPFVKPFDNKKDRFTDFFIKDVPFDHKTSVFPWRYWRSVDFAIKNKGDLIDWLYHNQSRQQRFHMKNRLFVVVYSRQWAHWMLKAELWLFKKTIESYLSNFNPTNLYRFESNQWEVLSDILWIVR